MSSLVHSLVIIGSGPAGLTAGIYAARANLKPIIIEGKNPGGQLMGTTTVENWPGNREILGPQLMLNMREHARDLGCTFITQEVTGVDSIARPFILTTKDGPKIKSHALIVATGATPKRLGCPGEDTYWGRGVSTCAVCDGSFYGKKPVIIVGGGDTAMEDASFMARYTDQITLVHILDKLTASEAMKERVIDNPAIKIIYNSTVTEIHGDGTHITGATITNQETKGSYKLDTSGVFIAIGLNPNTQLFKGQLALDDYGFIKITDHTKSSVPGIFVAGDVADSVYRQAITSAGTGCMAALDADRYLKSIHIEAII